MKDVTTATPTATEQALLAQIDALKAKLEVKNKLSFKVGVKGGMSIYGLNSKFPTTLYADQWRRLLAAGPEIITFLDTNASVLKAKE